MSTLQLNLTPDLEALLRFEMLLTELSAGFVSVVSGSLDAAIVDAQEQIVRVLERERSTLAQIEDDGELFVVTHSWQLPDVQPFPKGFTGKDLPWRPCSKST